MHIIHALLTSALLVALGSSNVALAQDEEPIPILSVRVFSIRGAPGPDPQAQYVRWNDLVPPARLTASIASVTVHHVENQKVSVPDPAGGFAKEFRDYFYVSVLLDEGGYRELSRLSEAMDRGHPRLKRGFAVIVADSSGGFRATPPFTLDEASKTATIRLKLSEPQVLALMKSVHDDGVPLDIREWETGGIR